MLKMPIEHLAARQVTLLEASSAHVHLALMSILDDCDTLDVRTELAVNRTERVRDGPAGNRMLATDLTNFGHDLTSISYKSATTIPQVVPQCAKKRTRYLPKAQMPPTPPRDRRWCSFRPSPNSKSHGQKAREDVRGPRSNACPTRSQASLRRVRRPRPSGRHVRRGTMLNCLRASGSDIRSRSPRHVGPRLHTL